MRRFFDEYGEKYISEFIPEGDSNFILCALFFVLYSLCLMLYALQSLLFTLILIIYILVIFNQYKQ